nr:peroxiredoxin [Ruegeria pomeroyi]
MKTATRLPSIPVQQLSGGEVGQIDLAARSAGKTVVLVGVPGAFTPTCSDDHVPGYLRDAQALGAAGVDEIIILATSDFFVVKAWADRMQPPDAVQFVADGGLGFTRAMGQILDLTELGLGLRTQRYAAVIRDGDVVWMAVEPDAGGVTVSGSANVLAAL